MRNRVEIKKKMDTEIFLIFKKRQSGQAKKKQSMGNQEKNHKIVKKNIWEEKSKNRHLGCRYRHRHLGCRCRLSLTGTGTGTGTFGKGADIGTLGCRLSLTGTGTGTGTFGKGAESAPAPNS